MYHTIQHHSTGLSCYKRKKKYRTVDSVVMFNRDISYQCRYCIFSGCHMFAAQPFQLTNVGLLLIGLLWKFQLNWSKYTTIFFGQNESANAGCKMGYMLSRPPYVNRGWGGIEITGDMSHGDDTLTNRTGWSHRLDGSCWYTMNWKWHMVVMCFAIWHNLVMHYA